MPSKLRIGFLVNVFPVRTQQYLQDQLMALLGLPVDIHLFVHELNSEIFFPFERHSNLYIHFIKPIGFYNKAYSLLRLFHPRRAKSSINTFINKYIARKPCLNHGIRINTELDILHITFAVHLKEVIELKQEKKINYKKLVVSGRGYDVSMNFTENPDNYIPYFPFIDKYLPVSKSLVHNFLQNGFDPNKIEVLHDGIDLSHLPYIPREKDVNKKRYHLVAIGRLVEKKGHLYSIKAIELLRAEGYDIIFEIYGDGPMQQELQQYISSKRLTDHILLRGTLSHNQIIPKIQKADIFILHSITSKKSDMEGIPNVLKEAMALGTPVVSTKHSGITELIPSNEYGLLCDEKDYYAMAKNIKLVFEMNAESTQKMLYLARKKVEADYDITELTKKLISIYTGLLK